MTTATLIKQSIYFGLDDTFGDLVHHRGGEHGSTQADTHGAEVPESSIHGSTGIRKRETVGLAWARSLVRKSPVTFSNKATPPNPQVVPLPND